MKVSRILYCCNRSWLTSAFYFASCLADFCVNLLLEIFGRPRPRPFFQVFAKALLQIKEGQFAIYKYCKYRGDSIFWPEKKSDSWHCHIVRTLVKKIWGWNIHTLRSLINVQSLITVQGGQFFTKSLKSAQALSFSHSLGPRDSKMSKFSHLEIYLVVLEQLTGL